MRRYSRKIPVSQWSYDVAMAILDFKRREARAKDGSVIKGEDDSRTGHS